MVPGSEVAQGDAIAEVEGDAAKRYVERIERQRARRPLSGPLARAVLAGELPDDPAPGTVGLVLAEANAAGVPVIAMDLGSCREVIQDGRTGFLVNNVHEAVQDLQRLSEIDRSVCRQRVQQRFSIESMVESYERVYRTIFDLESTSRL